MRSALSPRRLIGPLLGIAALLWLLSRIDYTRLGEHWRGIDIRLLLLSILLAQLSVFVRALRWRYLLLTTRPIGPRHLYSAVAVNMAANWILPFRLGEMAGAYSLRQLEPVPFSTLIASVVVDRILDMVWLAAATLALLSWEWPEQVVIPESLFGVTVGISPKALRVSAIALAVILATALAFLALLSRGHSRFSRALGRSLERVAPRAHRVLGRAGFHFSLGLQVLRQPAHLAMAAALTVVIWGLYLAAVLLLLWSFPISAHPTALQALAVLVFVAAGLMLPNPPAYIGTLHVVIVLALVLSDPGMSLERALSFAIVYHLAQLIPTVMIGGAFMWWDNLSIMPRRDDLPRGDETSPE
ncbi:flippase-like domain-containing protein [Candidatus Sumerlaeota bacterium]|nr:flippase-like domain-containing protein [Candidatus Sumerlaeota bacterium]